MYFSRSAGSRQSHKDFFTELEAQGCTVQTVTGDISDPADALRAVEAATTPIAGVLHMAMVLQDRPFLAMSHEDWLVAIKSEVAGTLNLHTALLKAKTDLNFFVMFGSISGHLRDCASTQLRGGKYLSGCLRTIQTFTGSASIRSQHRSHG